MLTNGRKSRYAIQLTSAKHGTTLRTPFLHRLLGIIVGMQATEGAITRTAFTDNYKSTTTIRVKEALREGSRLCFKQYQRREVRNQIDSTTIETKEGGASF